MMSTRRGFLGSLAAIAGALPWMGKMRAAPAIPAMPTPAGPVLSGPVVFMSNPMPSSPIHRLFTLAAGSLPPGMTLDASTGAITGTPERPGVFTYILRAQDTDGSHEDMVQLIDVPSADRWRAIQAEGKPVLSARAWPAGKRNV